MAATSGGFLVEATTYLGAASIAIPIFNRLKLGSILGYLVAGIIIGPFGLGLIQQEETVFHVAELGVVLFLFIVGLELSLSRLWSMRRQIFGLGLAQMSVTAVVIASLFVSAGVMSMTAAIIAGLSFAFSSTAFALQLLRDRGEVNTAYGQSAFSILLFQDLAVIPLLALIPIVAATGEVSGGDGMTLWAIVKAFGVIAVLIVIGKFGLNRFFQFIASAGSREAFAATALFVVALTALAVSWAGLSMALGAFLAGVLLAESSYRHQIETDIEPFRGLLLGLFFMSIGMRLDFAVIIASWWIVLGGAFGLVFIKALLIYGVGKLSRSPHAESIRMAAVLSQGGEFAFVVVSLGTAAALFTNGQATLMTAIVTISMALTPLMMLLAERLTPNKGEDDSGLEPPKEREGHILVAGFGRMGQIIAQVLMNSGYDVIALDNNPAHIRNAERFGYKVFYGDASRLDVLTTAGALEARAVILCMDDPKSVNQATQLLRHERPRLNILSVAHDRLHEIDLQKLDPTVIVRETMESSLLVAKETLTRLGEDDATIADFVQQFRKFDRQRLLAQIDAGPEAGKELLHQRYRAIEKRA